MFFHALEYSIFQLRTNTEWFERLKWFANINMYISAILLSFSVSWSTTPTAFIGFLIAHIIWVFAGIAMKDKPIIALNGFFIPLDLYAMAIRF